MSKTFVIQIPFRAAVVAVGLATLSATNAHAGNAGASLPACYDHVITACNQTAHPVPCSEAGMDACDDYHSSNGAMGALDRIRILVGPGDTPSYRAVLETERPRPQRPTGGGDDGDRPDPMPTDPTPTPTPGAGAPVGLSVLP
jgi:hypothetical protein